MALVRASPQGWRAKISGRLLLAGRMFDPGRNPLIDDDSGAWTRLIDAIGPAALLILIETRISAALRATVAAEDILQDALLHAWRDRERHEWRGLRAFRAWLVAIIENRIRDAADRVAARKRGNGSIPLTLDHRPPAGATTMSVWAGPVASTTPSRAAAAREEAELMRAALEALPEEVREVVRLRLFEQLSVAAIAARLDIGPSAVRHRFRRGAELYQAALKHCLIQSGRFAALAPVKSSHIP